MKYIYVSVVLIIVIFASFAIVLNGIALRHDVHEVSVNGEKYYVEVVTIHLPPQGVENSTKSVFNFKGDTFTLWVSGWWSPAGGFLNGIVKTINRQNFAFSISGIVSSFPKSWFSPAADTGVEWLNYGNSVELLVEAT